VEQHRKFNLVLTCWSHLGGRVARTVVSALAERRRYRPTPASLKSIQPIHRHGTE